MSVLVCLVKKLKQIWDGRLVTVYKCLKSNKTQT